jgi:hypothetical protein
MCVNEASPRCRTAECALPSAHEPDAVPEEIVTMMCTSKWRAESRHEMGSTKQEGERWHGGTSKQARKSASARRRAVGSGYRV